MADRTGVLLMAYGTPRSPADVEAYYTHIRRGRPPTAEALADLRARYDAIGGSSPLLAITEAQARSLQSELDAREGGRWLVALGMKHAPPFIEDAAAQLLGAGVGSIVGLVLAPHYSALSVGEYEQRVRAAAGDAQTSMVRSWHLADGYLDLLAERLADAVGRLPAEQRDAVHVLVTAHSLPSRIVADGDPYPRQLRETGEALAVRGGLTHWSIAWQSAGATSEPWLGPDVLEVIPALPATGARAVVVCAAGFVTDHLEVLYDLDVEARRAATAAGLGFERTEMPNDDPRLAVILADAVMGPD